MILCFSGVQPNKKSAPGGDIPDMKTEYSALECKASATTGRLRRHGETNEVEIISHVTPRQNVARRIEELQRALEDRHQELLQEVRYTRKFNLRCFSSLLLELPEVPVSPPVTNAQDRVARFLKGLGLNCSCLEP